MHTNTGEEINTFPWTTLLSYRGTFYCVITQQFAHTLQDLYDRHKHVDWLAFPNIRKCYHHVLCHWKTVQNSSPGKNYQLVYF